MNTEYRELRRLLASYLKHIAKQSEASCLQIMFILKTADQVFVMLDYLDKHKNEPFDEYYTMESGSKFNEILLNLKCNLYTSK